ncbi:BgTH12-00611 [Blumeria graminis f. sp. triticale]|uniref:Bgt-20687 n=3 Tax=Blumeria graminis TaxID=34373 RepID=A0A9X9MM67_BLUGR|nr:BgTH12-00611 [Blumeria graminis f. sp. triticale]VDB93122.1 Bgt-20687 [Blumeria graminis f. sp. tritici]
MTLCRYHTHQRPPPLINWTYLLFRQYPAIRRRLLRCENCSNIKHTSSLSNTGQLEPETLFRSLNFVS